MNGDGWVNRERMDAFVDGELEPEDAARVVMHLADNPADRALVDELANVNELLGQAYDDVMTEPVPEALLATILADARGAAPLPVRRRIRSPGLRLRRLFPSRRILFASVPAIAAALLAAIFLFDDQMEPSLLPRGPVAADSAAGMALDGLLSGEVRRISPDAEMVVVASYDIPGTGICREFELVRASLDKIEFGLACRVTPGAWEVVVSEAEVQDTASEDTIRPASGPAGDPVGDYLEKIGAGAVMDGTAENDARAREWNLADQ